MRDDPHWLSLKQLPATFVRTHTQIQQPKHGAFCCFLTLSVLPLISPICYHSYQSPVHLER